MKYLITIMCLALSVSAVASEKKTAQQKVWTDDYQYGENETKATVSENKKLAQDSQPDGNKKTPKSSPSNGGWTDEYQYGEKSVSPKTDKPSKNGEFEVAPKK